MRLLFALVLALAGGLASAEPLPFCHSGVDCTPTVEGFPVIRTVTIYNRGPKAGIRVEPAGELTFPRGVLTKMRIVNESAFQVWFSGNLTTGWLRSRDESPGPDTIVSDVGVPGKIELDNRAGDRIIVPLRLETTPKPPPGAGALLRGTYRARDGEIAEARVRFFPSVGAKCKPVESLNRVDSVRDCVRGETCGVETRLRIALHKAGESTPIVDWNFYPNQCNAYGDRHSSRFTWHPASAESINMRSDYHASLGTYEVQLHLRGNADGLTGEACGLFGNPLECGALALRFDGIDEPF